MATCTFGKKISVEKKDASSFAKEMSKKAEPTLSNDFKTGFVNIVDDAQLKNKLMAIVGKN